MKENVKMLSMKVIKHLKNSWIKVKRSELPQQMESLVPFLSDGTGVKTPFRGVLKDRSEVFIPMDCFHLFIMYLDRPVSMPLKWRPVSMLLKSAIVSLVLVKFS